MRISIEENGTNVSAEISIALDAALSFMRNEPFFYLRRIHLAGRNAQTKINKLVLSIFYGLAIQPQKSRAV